ncbi:MAG TPA: DUF1971 domain-containing protein [Sphingomicrobium sp.]|nr:DUF1971 domain-containing protein [Sphingomicrobium sp.]
MTPYRTTAIFDETTLPAALRREHRTKAGAWGIIRMLEGKLALVFPDGRREMLTPDRTGLIRPEEPHWVEPNGPMRMQVEFYDSDPDVR